MVQWQVLNILLASVQFQVSIVILYSILLITSHRFLALTPESLSNNSSLFNISFGGVVNAVKRSSIIMTEKLSSIGNNDNKDERAL